MELIKLIKRIKDIDLGHGSLKDKYDLILRYVTFLLRGLELGMFIPCDLDGNVLEKPIKHVGVKSMELKSIRVYEALRMQYQEALDRVLFEGFRIKETRKGEFLLDKDSVCIMYLNTEKDKWETILFKTIEDLTELGLTLTKSAKKELNK